MRDGSKQVFDKRGRRQRVIRRGDRAVVSKQDQARLVLSDPERVETVREIFRLYVRSGFGFKKIADCLNQKGLPSPRNGRWSKVHSQDWAMTTVRDILRNPAYTGDAVWNRRSLAKFHRISGNAAVPAPKVRRRAIEDNDESTKNFGEWVLRRACKDLRVLRANGIDVTVAVNISARHFVSEEFPDNLIQICREENCSPENFEIEITEETALNNEDGTGSIIGQLQDVGFKVSLDDYGRGYSNLTRLAELNVDTLKIDGPLTARLTRDERTKVIFEATINMANGLGSKTVAEGVETAAEVAILTSIGCTELQGFFFSTPLPMAELIAWIDERTKDRSEGKDARAMKRYA